MTGATEKPECPSCGSTHYAGGLLECPFCGELKCETCDMGNNVGCALCDADD